MKRPITIAGLAILFGCGSHTTPAIADLSIASPVTASTSGELVLSGQLKVSDSSGDSDFAAEFIFIDSTGKSSTLTTALTPGGGPSDPVFDAVCPFSLTLSPAWASGTYSVRVAVTDGNDGHMSNTLGTTIVVQ